MLYELAKALSRRPVNQAIARFCNSIPDGARVLTIGSGGTVEATIRQSLLDRPVQLVSADIDPLRKPDVVDDICRSGFADGSFDYILAVEVFEHLMEPRRASEELFRLLKAGGNALVTTPFIFMIHDAPYDFFRFTEYGLQRLFNNFDCVEVRSRGSWFDALAILVLRLPLIRSKLAHCLALLLMPVGAVIYVLVKLLPARSSLPLITPGYVTYLGKS